MTRLRLLAAGIAAATVAACGSDGGAEGTGCDEWIYAVDTELRRLDLFAYRDGEHVRLTDDHASSYPALSPDGETLAFVRGTGQWTECCGYEGHDLWTMDPDGTDAAPLMTDGDPLAPAWSPDGGRLAYIDVPAGSDEGRITVLDVASGERRTSDEATPSRTSRPTWSPDGTELAWVDPSTGDIVRLDVADGSTETMDVFTDRAIDLESPIAWTPDGEAFLVSGMRRSGLEDAHWRLLRIDAATGEATVVTEDVRLPVALEDGRIAGLIIDREGGDSELVVMDADGSDEETVAVLPIWFRYNGVDITPLTC